MKNQKTNSWRFETLSFHWNPWYKELSICTLYYKNQRRSLLHIILYLPVWAYMIRPIKKHQRWEVCIFWIKLKKESPV